MASMAISTFMTMKLSAVVYVKTCQSPASVNRRGAFALHSFTSLPDRVPRHIVVLLLVHAARVPQTTCIKGVVHLLPLYEACISLATAVWMLLQMHGTGSYDNGKHLRHSSQVPLALPLDWYFRILPLVSL